MAKRVLIFTIAAVLVSASLTAQAATYLIYPSKDAYVFSAMPDDNFGSDGTILTGCDYGSWLIRTYMTFSLSAIPATEQITGAVLHLYQYDGMGYASLGVPVYRLDNDTWDEASLTWNTMPDGGAYGSQIAYNENGNGYRGWSDWDLLASGAWNISADRGDGALSLVLREFENGDQGHNFRSSEYQYPEYLPYLEVTTVTSCECDLNSDGRCDMRDWLIFGRGWGRTDCPVQR